MRCEVVRVCWSATYLPYFAMNRANSETTERGPSYWRGAPRPEQTDESRSKVLVRQGAKARRFRKLRVLAAWSVGMPGAHLPDHGHSPPTLSPCDLATSRSALQAA